MVAPAALLGPGSDPVAEPPQRRKGGGTLGVKAGELANPVQSVPDGTAVNTQHPGCPADHASVRQMRLQGAHEDRNKICIGAAVGPRHHQRFAEAGSPGRRSRGDCALPVI
ncbi:hypothetical protein GCM10009559_08070 [Pseudonocardia zijingensis]|uniref:Uncharacterized protein n=1 Tax=Pseudonocardia zijingensis TaxID=153376 RepID=A0ABP3ZKX5_9PSEU